MNEEESKKPNTPRFSSNLAERAESGKFQRMNKLAQEVMRQDAGAASNFTGDHQQV